MYTIRRIFVVIIVLCWVVLSIVPIIILAFVGVPIKFKDVTGVIENILDKDNKEEFFSGERK